MPKEIGISSKLLQGTRFLELTRLSLIRYWMCIPFPHQAVLENVICFVVLAGYLLFGWEEGSVRGTFGASKE